MTKGAKTKRERHERRFFPNSSANPKVVAILGGVGALLVGAGAKGQLWPAIPDEPYKLIPWLLAAGTALIGAAFWFGTSGEPPIRVGDAGVGVDKGSMPRHVPWYGVEAIRWDSAAQAVVVEGKDEATLPLTIVAKTASHPLAAAWIVREARARIPKTVDVAEDVALAATNDSDGEMHKLEPVQVVGKRCAASDKVISFEPDARLCTRCERVYHKNHVPKKCACGASLGAKGHNKSDDDEDAA